MLNKDHAANLSNCSVFTLELLHLYLEISFQTRESCGVRKWLLAWSCTCSRWMASCHEYRHDNDQCAYYLSAKLENNDNLCKSKLPMDLLSSSQFVAYC